MLANAIPVLDHGYVLLVESWGHGLEGLDPIAYGREDDCEVGIIEAARMSSGKGFLGWEPKKCPDCDGEGTIHPSGATDCATCDGKGMLRGDYALLAYLEKKRHTSPFEMAGMTLEVQAPLIVFREWHRHRTQSYNEMSAHYTPLPDVNYMPTVERCMAANTANKQANAVKGAVELDLGSVWVWIANSESDAELVVG